MTPAELIREVIALPPEERAQFLELIHTLEKGASPTAPSNGQHWPDFTERLHRIYGNKVAPNSQSIIDDGRGER